MNWLAGMWLGVGIVFGAALAYLAGVPQAITDIIFIFGNALSITCAGFFTRDLYREWVGDA